MILNIIKKLIPLFAMLLVVPAFSATEIREAVLAQDVVERNPDEALTGTQSCGNEADPTLVSSDSINRLYLWNRVNNDEERQLVHSWQQNVDGQWSERANVSLRVGVSAAWRTWSSKNIDPYFHKGDWRVVVSTQEALEDVLCVVHFTVN